MGFKASLGYIGSSRLPWITRNIVLKPEKKPLKINLITQRNSQKFLRKSAEK